MKNSLKKIEPSLNIFFQKIVLKKQYTNNLKIKIDFLLSITRYNYKTLNLNIFLVKQIYFITYILEVLFSWTNTWITVSSSQGNLIHYYSSGSFLIKGKRRRTRHLLFQHIKKLMTGQLKFLKCKTIALHLKNVKFLKFWILKELRKKLFIQTLCNLTNYPYNGCRKPKIWRK